MSQEWDIYGYTVALSKGIEKKRGLKKVKKEENGERPADDGDGPLPSDGVQPRPTHGDVRHCLLPRLSLPLAGAVQRD